jgi:L-rhamnose mutarotase
MIRKSFVMTLKPGDKSEYQKRHNPIWPELQSTLFSHGVRNYSIFLHPDGRQLFAYAEIEDEERWDGIANTEVCQRWWSHMSGLMETNEDGSPKAVDCREVFHIDNLDEAKK